MDLKFRLQYYLDRYNMNATELARKTFVPRQNISNWLMGQKPKDVDQVKRVADYFNTTVDDILYGRKVEDSIPTDILSGVYELRITKRKEGLNEK